MIRLCGKGASGGEREVAPTRMPGLGCVERVKASFTLPVGSAPRSWRPVMARDRQASALGFGLGFLGWGFFFFLFTAHGKFFSPQVGREKLGAGVGKSGQKAQGRGGGSCWRGSVISQTQELRSCRGSRRHSPAGRCRGHQPPLPWETRWKTELKSILGWERSSSLPGARPRFQRRLLDHGAGVSRWSRGDAVEEGPGGPHLLRGAVRSTQPPPPPLSPPCPLHVLARAGGSQGALAARSGRRGGRAGSRAVPSQGCSAAE